MNTSLFEKAALQNERTRTSEAHNMATKRVVIPGIVKNGFVVPQKRHTFA